MKICIQVLETSSSHFHPFFFMSLMWNRWLASCAFVIIYMNVHESESSRCQMQEWNAWRQGLGHDAKHNFATKASIATKKGSTYLSLSCILCLFVWSIPAKAKSQRTYAWLETRKGKFLVQNRFQRTLSKTQQLETRNTCNTCSSCVRVVSEHRSDVSNAFIFRTSQADAKHCQSAWFHKWIIFKYTCFFFSSKTSLMLGFSCSWPIGLSGCLVCGYVQQIFKPFQMQFRYRELCWESCWDFSKQWNGYNLVLTIFTVRLLGLLVLGFGIQRRSFSCMPKTAKLSVQKDFTDWTYLKLILYYLRLLESTGVSPVSLLVRTAFSAQPNKEDVQILVRDGESEQWGEMEHRPEIKSPWPLQLEKSMRRFLFRTCPPL